MFMKHVQNKKLPVFYLLFGYLVRRVPRLKSRFKKWLEFKIRGKGFEILYNLNGSRFLLKLDDWIPWCIYLHGYYDIELEELKYILRRVKGDTFFFDIGSNFGYYSVQVGQRLKKAKGKIYAFEPVPDIYEWLKMNVSLNNLSDRIECFNLAISNENGQRDINVSTSFNTGMSSLVYSPVYNDRKQVETINVPIKTFDSFVKEYEIENIDIIKIDIEGGELEALYGMKDTLANSKPELLVEIEPEILKKAKIDYREIFHFLEKFHYRPFIPTNNTLIEVKDIDKFTRSSLVVFK